ncbi:hypothetical protein PHYNN_91 [Pantoea phage Phynn]|nr:hypothetical protein PHYNN_91 [Pantoea phage Phynn]
MDSDPSLRVLLIDRKIKEIREEMGRFYSHPSIVDYLARKLTVYEAIRRNT